jgi:hypothetical protein
VEQAEPLTLSAISAPRWHSGVVQSPAQLSRRSPGVEANARLTAATGVLLLVMLAAEGFTILSIHPLLAWHVAIGLALLPPVALKTASTGWRFARYYLGDTAYRRAGPPHPVLRVLGPFVVLTTFAVLATGLATWLAGPTDHLLLTLHKASFVLWFAGMTLHVLGHVVDTGRSVRADVDDGFRGSAVDSHAATNGVPRRATVNRGAVVPHAVARHGVVVLSLAAGVVVALTTRGIAGSLSGWGHHIH